MSNIGMIFLNDAGCSENLHVTLMSAAILVNYSVMTFNYTIYSQSMEHTSVSLHYLTALNR